MGRDWASCAPLGKGRRSRRSRRRDRDPTVGKSAATTPGDSSSVQETASSADSGAGRPSSRGSLDLALGDLRSAALRVDSLSAATSASTLSSRSTISCCDCRTLSSDKQRARIAEALGVTIYDLGAPTAEVEAAGAATVLERLDSVEADVAALRELLVGRERPAVAAGDRRPEERPSEDPREQDRDPREDGLPAPESAEDRDVLR